ncbi:MAG: hypothetical protein QNL04_06080 [SAR324 cluster bacterium]|nr:hypothetical protein [SAR324 cluster bacterium]
MSNHLHIGEDFDSKAYLKVLISVAMADGEIQPSELQFIELQARLLSLDFNLLIKEPSLDLESYAHKLSSKTKRVILRDCICMGYVDDHYSQDERQKIKSIASQLGLSSKDAVEMENWLKDYWKHLKEGERLLEKT